MSHIIDVDEMDEEQRNEIREEGRRLQQIFSDEKVEELTKDFLGTDILKQVEYGKEDEAIAKIINDFKEELDATFKEHNIVDLDQEENAEEEQNQVIEQDDSDDEIEDVFTEFNSEGFLSDIQNELHNYGEHLENKK